MDIDELWENISDNSFSTLYNDDFTDCNVLKLWIPYINPAVDIRTYNNSVGIGLKRDFFLKSSDKDISTHAMAIQNSSNQPNRHIEC